MSRIVCVSGRVQPNERDSRDPVTLGIRAALEQRGGGVWFGWDGSIINSRDERRRVHKTVRGAVTFLTIPLLHEEYKSCYKCAVNDCLWALLHEHKPLTEENSPLFYGYRQVNYVYATHLRTFLEPDDIIWVQDYHLIPLAEALRNIGVSNRIVYFHHYPVPDKNFVRGETVPQAARTFYEELIRKLFAYDQVGFQSFRDLHNFIDYIGYRGSMPKRFTTATMAYAGHEGRFGVFPSAIPTMLVEAQATEDADKTEARLLGMRLDGRSLIIGSAPHDLTGGTGRALQGLARYLAQNFSEAGKISYAHVATHRDRDHAHGLANSAEIDKALAEILRTYGDEALIDGGDVPPQEKLSWFRHARVGLITPLMDGQNLCAKEFIAAQNPADPGILVLSQYAGAAEELADHGALPVDPHDPEDIARNIAFALSMSQQERVERHAQALTHLRAHDAAHWSHSFLSQAEMRRESETTPVTPPFLRMPAGDSVITETAGAF